MAVTNFSTPYSRRMKRVQRERTKFLSDPSKAQNIIANALSTQVPPSIKISRSKYANKLAAVEAAIPREDPRHDMGTSIYNRYQDVIQDPAYSKYTPREVIAALWQNTLDERKNNIYKYTQQQQTGAFRILNKPVVELPGQKQWEEKKRPIEHATAQTDIKWGLGTAGLWKAGKYFVKKGLSKEAIRTGIKLGLRGLTKAPSYVGIAATAALSVADIYAFEEAEQRVARTKYAREHPIQGDVAALAAGFATGHYAGKIGTKIAKRTFEKFLAANTMKETIGAATEENPTMHQIMLYSDAHKEANTAAEGVSKALHRQRSAVVQTLMNAMEKERGERPLSPLYKPPVEGVKPNVIPMPGDVTIPMASHVGKPNLPRLISKRNVPALYKISQIKHVDKVIDLVSQGKSSVAAVNKVGEMEYKMLPGPKVKIGKINVSEDTAKAIKTQKVAQATEEKLAPDIKSKVDLSEKKPITNLNYGVHLDEEASKYFSSLGSGEIPESNGEWKSMSKGDLAKRALVGFGVVSAASQLTPTKEAKASYIGELAKMAPKALLKGAKYAEKLGIDASRKGVIREKTGWFKGLDNKWRYEISDKDVKLLGKATPGRTTFLSNVISHKDLFKNYPQLRTVKVAFTNGLRSYDAVASPNLNMIRIGVPSKYNIFRKADETKLKKTIIHETQHFIQDYEGFATGGTTEITSDVRQGIKNHLIVTNPNYKRENEIYTKLTEKAKKEHLTTREENSRQSALTIKSDIYRNYLDRRYGTNLNMYRHIAGELEARDVEARMNYTNKERKMIAPYSSELNNPYSGIHENNLIYRFAKGPAHIGKIAGTLAGTVALLPIVSLVSPKDANAAGLGNLGAVSDVVGRIIEKAKPGRVVTLLKDMKKAGYIVEPQKNPHILPNPMRAVRTMPKLSDIQNKILKIGKVGNFALSPSLQFLNEMGVRNGQELMNNAGIEWANHQTAAIVNTVIGQRTFMNIMHDYIPGYKSYAKDVIAAMDPVVKKYFPLMQERAFHFGEMKNYEDLMKKEWKKVSKKAKYSKKKEEKVLGALEEFENQYNIHKAAYESSHPMVAKYHNEWTKVAKALVNQKNQNGVRVFLAAEDTPDFKYYPFLKGKLSFEEQAAVGKIKGMMEHYTGRVIDVGEKPLLERPFMHHAWHPGMESSKILDELKKRFPGDASSIPMLKLHSRSVGFMPMVPDAEYSTTTYLSDINTRLEAMNFWRKGKPDGWWAFKNAITENPGLASEDLIGAFKSFQDGFKPYERTTLNKFSDRVYAFEVARLLGFSLSVPFKHSLKVLASMRTFGMESVKSIPKALTSAVKVAIKQRGGEQWLKDKGLGLDLMDEAVEAYTETGKLYRLVSDVSPFKVNQAMADKVLDQINSIGGTPVAATERFDRALSVVSAMRMAAKKGMTTDQAVYGVFDTILKNNFLAGPLNPAWLRNPKIRLMLTFQGTPWKIMEQRASIWGRAGSNLIDTLKMLKNDVIQGGQEFKWEMIKQGLTKDKDIFGTSLMSQTIRELMLIGAGVEAGKAIWDVDLAHHFFHVPVIDVQRKNIAIGSSPIISAALQTASDKEDDEFIVSRFFRHWFQTRKGGIPAPIPLAFKKAVRLSRDDIPKIYQNRKLLYLFGIPSEK